MKDKNTRVEISAELRESLNDYIEEQKANGVKGLTRIKVIDQLCKAGLAFQKQPELGGMIVPGSMGIKQPARLYPNEYFTETKSELKAMQEALYQKEKRLIKKEQSLLEKEEAINRKHYNAIKYYEDILKKQPDPTKSFIHQMKNDQKFEEIKRGIEQGNDKIRDEIKSMNRDILRRLREIKSNTQEDVFYDKILPGLTALGVSVNAFQQFRKDKDFKLDTVIKDLIGGFGKSPQADTGTIPKDKSNNTNKTEGQEQESK